MDSVTSCLHGGKRMVPAPSLTGRTELIHVYCDAHDPMEMPEAKKWPRARSQALFPRQSLKRACSQQSL